MNVCSQFDLVADELFKNEFLTFFRKGSVGGQRTKNQRPSGDDCVLLVRAELVPQMLKWNENKRDPYWHRS